MNKAVLVAALALLGLDLPAAPMASPASAEVCGRCHRAIHEAWKTSAHARAMESRLFQDVLEMAESEFGAESRRVCLGCHSPVAVRVGDLGLQRKVSWEGVTCDYCHSLREVTLAEPNPRVRIEFTSLKSGPLKQANSSAHASVYSAVHTTSLACAPCHEYRNALGFSVLTTYSEWQKSPAGKAGRNCQSCHMYTVAGNVVDPRVLLVQNSKVNLHQMPGSHSVDQLNRTVAATLSTSRGSGQLKVAVEVINRAAGHFVPTGSPLRRLVLEVSADSYDGKHFKGQRTYQRVVADQAGKAVTREHVAFLKGAKVLSDTRLGAGEKRTEVFSFPIPEGVQTQVKAALWYYYSPMARDDQQRVAFLTLQRLVR